MSGADLRIVHLAFDHASVRALHALLQQGERSVHWWWVEPHSTLQGKPHEWHNALTTAEVPAKLAEADAVVIHRLKGANLDWIQRIPDNVPVVWATWGDDYYRVLRSLNRSLFLPWTAVLNVALGKMSITAQRLGSVFGGAEKRFTQACQRVDAVSTLMGENAPFFGVFSDPKPRTYPSFYNPTPPESDVQWCTEVPGRVLLGTNASNTSNHLDLIHRLRRARPPQHVRFCAGLSYGSARYGKAIDVLGARLLSHWEGQFDHLPRQAYGDWLCTHNVLVMNNVRTQGTGVLVMALWYGMRVVVRPDAHITPFLNAHGFAFDCLPAHGWHDEFYAPLNAQERAHNRDLAARVFGQEQRLDTVNAMLEDLQSGRLTRRLP